MKKYILFILFLLTMISPSFAFQRDVGNSRFIQDTDKFSVNQPLASPIKAYEVSTACTIGSTCDGTSIAAALGGAIMITAAITVTLPQIVTTNPPNPDQVNIGASICFFVRDNSETVIIKPHYNDSIRMAATKDTANDGITNTSGASSGGDSVCLIAFEADAWTVMGKSGTWTAQ